MILHSENCASASVKHNRYRHISGIAPPIPALAGPARLPFRWNFGSFRWYPLEVNFPPTDGWRKAIYLRAPGRYSHHLFRARRKLSVSLRPLTRQTKPTSADRNEVHFASWIQNQRDLFSDEQCAVHVMVEAELTGCWEVAVWRCRMGGDDSSKRFPEPHRCNWSWSLWHGCCCSLDDVHSEIEYKWKI